MADSCHLRQGLAGISLGIHVEDTVGFTGFFGDRPARDH